MKTIIAVHKLLIGAAIALAALLTIWEIANGKPMLALLCAVAGIGLAFYLRTVSRKYRDQAAPLPSVRR